MQHLPVAIDVAAVSDTGRVRRNNEDAVWIGGSFFRSGVRSVRFDAPIDRGLLFAVADGVGGSAAGEVASRWVVERFAARVSAVELPEGVEPAGRVLQRLASETNDELIADARRHPGRGGMATTYTAILLSPAGEIWLNAGDSRLYALEQGELRQISRDHTLREETGDPSIPGNIITNCFGTPDGFRLDTGPLDSSSVDAYLLCSDGLSDYADMRRVAEVITAVIEGDGRGGDGAPGDDAAFYLEHAANAALQLALEGGGGDNVTLLLARPLHG